MSRFVSLYLFLVSICGQSNAMEQLYNRALSSSQFVILCFNHEHPAHIIVTQKRLFFHICAQASKDKNFNANTFHELIKDINGQDDDIRPPIQTAYTALFHTLLSYIPWNGKTDTECGVAWHETIMNGRFVNLGINSDENIVYVMANNEDDFDSEMDHREKIENEFNALLAQSKKT
ncbi:hypothetical protein BH09DEP1_BH09DEP1_1690 [soil metagenome]